MPDDELRAALEVTQAVKNMAATFCDREAERALGTAAPQAAAAAPTQGCCGPGKGGVSAGGARLSALRHHGAGCEHVSAVDTPCLGQGSGACPQRGGPREKDRCRLGVLFLSRVSRTSGSCVGRASRAETRFAPAPCASNTHGREERVDLSTVQCERRSGACET